MRVAAAAILEAAGAGSKLLPGPLAYDKPGLKNEGFLAWGATPE